MIKELLGISINDEPYVDDNLYFILKNPKKSIFALAVFLSVFCIFASYCTVKVINHDTSCQAIQNRLGDYYEIQCQ